MNLMKLISFLCLFYFSLGALIFCEENVKKRLLPKQNEIFTIAFNVNGLTKESIDIYTKETLIAALEKAEYIGKYISQLKGSLEKNYWNQHGIIVLNNKKIISFIVYEEKGKKLPNRYLLVYFGDGHGDDLYRLP